MKIPFIKCVMIVGMMLLSASAVYADDPVVEARLILFNRTFDPQELMLPAGKKIKLIITNKDASNAEFESPQLNREKVVKANAEIYVYLGPLKVGVYSFFDDFHRQTTAGKIIVQ